RPHLALGLGMLPRFGEVVHGRLPLSPHRDEAVADPLDVVGERAFDLHASMVDLPRRVARSPAGELDPVAALGQPRGDLLAVVALDLDGPVLRGAACSTQA